MERERPSNNLGLRVLFFDFARFACNSPIGRPMAPELIPRASSSRDGSSEPCVLCPLPLSTYMIDRRCPESGLDRGTAASGGIYGPQRNGPLGRWSVGGRLIEAPETPERLDRSGETAAEAHDRMPSARAESGVPARERPVHEGIRDGFERADRVADTARRRFGRLKSGGSPGNRGVFSGEPRSRNTSEFNVIGPVLQSIHSIQQWPGAQRRRLSTTRRAIVTMAQPASEMRGV